MRTTCYLAAGSGRRPAGCPTILMRERAGSLRPIRVTRDAPSFPSRSTKAHRRPGAGGRV